MDFPGLWCRSSIWKIKGHFCFPMAHDLPIECYKFASQQSWIDAQSLGFRTRLRTPVRYVPDGSGCIRRISTEKWTILGLGTLTWFFDLGGLYLVVITSLLYFGDLDSESPICQHGNVPPRLETWSSQTRNNCWNAVDPCMLHLRSWHQLEKGWKDCSQMVSICNHDAGMFVDVSTTQEPGSNHRSIAFRYNRVPKFWIPNRWTMTISNLFFGHLEPDDSNHPLSAFFWPRNPWSFLFRHVQIDEFSIKV